MSNAFADGACELIVAPVSSSRLTVGRDVGRNDSSRQTLDWKNLSRTFLSRYEGRSRRFPVVLRMALEASQGAAHQVLAASEAGRRAFEMAIGQGTRPRTDEWPPSNG